MIKATSSVAAGSYVAVTPFRLADTRPNSGQPDAGKTLGAGQTLNVQVTGLGGVPAGAAAAVLNVTAVDPTAAGFLTVYPEGGTLPTVSNLNFAAGDTVPNLVTVGLSSTGMVSIYNSAGSTNVVVDVYGYYTSTPATNGSGLYNPLSPSRVMGTLQIGEAIGPNATQVISPSSLSAAGVPSTATAVVLNVTAAHATAPSFLTVYPFSSGASQPFASNLNFGAQVPNQAIANRVTVGIGSGGVAVYNHAGTVNVDADVNGYYTGAGGVGSTFVAIQPVRLTDTRSNTNGTAIAPSATETFNLSNASVPATAAAVAANFTVIPGDAPGYLTVYPTSDGTNPVASDVNWTANESPAVPNFTIADTASTGTVKVFNSHGATINLVIDAFGYFTSTTAQLTLSPSTQSDFANGSTTATVTATATLPGGVAAVGYPIYYSIPEPDGTTDTGSCTTDASGQCTITSSANTAVGSATVTAMFDQDFDESGVTDTDSDSDPTATATITWVAGTAAGITVDPGSSINAFASDNSPSCAVEATSPFSANCGNGGVEYNAYTEKVGSAFTAYAYVTDSKGNPISNTPVTFVIDHATPQTAPFSGNNTCDPMVLETGGTSSACTTSTLSATTNSSGVATVTWTDQSQGADFYYAYLSDSSAIYSTGAEVDWGTWGLTLSPTYTASGSTVNVGQSVSYTGTATTGTGAPNTSCVVVAFYESKSNSSPQANVNDNTTAAYFSGVATGETAYSSDTCTGTPINFSTTKPTIIYIVPSSTTGQFTFSIASSSPTMGTPEAFNTTQDQAALMCDTYGGNAGGYGYCGDAAAGATTTWQAIPASAYSVTMSPTSNTSTTVGSKVKYTETVDVNGTANTSASVPNAFSFNQLVNGGTTPATIAYTEFTQSGTTYCEAGSGTCPTGDNTTLPTGVTITYSVYGSATAGNTEVEVTGVGTFSPTITSASAGFATPVGWADVNNDQTLDSGDPSALGGTTTWAIPVASGLAVAVTNTSNSAAIDQYSDGSYWNSTSNTTTVTASTVDQAGNPITAPSGDTTQFTITNTGTSGTIDLSAACGTSISPAEAIGPGASYTLSSPCAAGSASVVLGSSSSSSAANASVSAQLMNASGTDVGSPQTAAVGFGITPSAAGQVSGTIVAFDNSNYPEATSETAGTGTHDFVVVKTTVGTYLVQFDQNTTQSYVVSGTSTTEAQFEAALGSATSYVVSDYGATQINSIN